MTDPAPHALRIRGEFTPDPAVCRFVVSRELFPEEFTFQFTSPADAPGSALIAALFALPGVTDVKIRRDTFTITKASAESWPALAGKLIPVLKEHLSGEVELLDPARRQELSTAPLGPDIPEKIRALLDQKINPMLQSHGGWVKYLRSEGRDVYVEMGGGCQGCASSQATMKFGIERAIKDAFPQVDRVIDATDHEAGANPYYA